jgi:hypothetical protein
MLFFPGTAERVFAYNPEMKLLAVLRNPVDRAYSAYWFARRNGWERAETFEEALDLEPQRLMGRFKERAELTYLHHGHYAEQLAAWFSVFSRDRVRVVLSDDLRHHTQDTVEGVLAWLGVEERLDLDTGRMSNVSGIPRVGWLQRVLLADSRFKGVVRRVTTPALRHRVRRSVIRPVIRWNIRPSPYPPMEQATRSRLVDHFREHNERLEDLLGRDLSHWR